MLFEPSQNAISTLLQSPKARSGLETQQSRPYSHSYRAPTARDIPPVALETVRHIEAAEFDAYILQVGVAYEHLKKLEHVEDEISSSRDGRLYGGLEGDEGLSKGHAWLQPVRQDSNSPTTSAGATSIPKIYFSTNFQLQNPRIFDIVSEQSEIVSLAATITAHGEDAPGLRKALATNAILQEKLSWYLDTAEVYLIRAISMASTTLISALSSLQDLRLEAEESLEMIRALRASLSYLDKDVVTAVLGLLQKRRTLNNLRQMNGVVLQLKYIADKVGYTALLIDKGEVEEALLAIDDVERLISGERVEMFKDEPSTHIHVRDLRGSAVMRGSVDDIMMLRSRIDKIFESRVHGILVADLRNHVSSVSTEETLMRWKNKERRPARDISALPAYMRKIDQLRKALFPNILRLHQSRYISKVIQAYRGLVLREIRTIIRERLSDSTNDAKSSASASSGRHACASQDKAILLAQSICALNSVDAERLFADIFVGVTETLRRLQTQSSVLMQIAYDIEHLNPQDLAEHCAFQSPNESDKCSNQNPMFELQQEMYSAFDLSNLLGQAVDISHDKINKILRVRSDKSVNLSLDHFLRHFTLNLSFVNECEALSGRTGALLSYTIDGQNQNFIQAHQERELQALTLSMDVDNWQTGDFTAKDAEILTQILECGTSDPSAWKESTSICIPLSHIQAERTQRNENTIRSATIGGEMFLLPCSAILCLEGTSKYLRLVCGIQSMAPDIAMSLVAYFRTFDSRCRQLILGTGALHSAGLKNINTTHLAIAWRALSFIEAIVAQAHDFLRRHMPTGYPCENLTVEFDNVQHSLQKHGEAICQKLVDMMALRADRVSHKLRETKWTEGSSKVARDSMKDLAKDTSKLHTALNKYLPDRATSVVMVRVFANYKDQLSRAIHKANLQSEMGRDCLSCGVDEFGYKLRKIEEFGDLSTYLMKIIASKRA